MAKATKAITTSKSAAKKTPVKSATKKVTAKKVAPKKATVAKKVTPKKTTATKATPKKAVTKQVALQQTGGSSEKLGTRTKAKKLSNAELLTKFIVEGMQEIKASNIVIMDLRAVENSSAEFFVICQAESTTQVDAIANSIWEEVRKGANEKPYHIEGKGNAQWILLDYVNVVAHVFQSEARFFYNLEKLWGDAEFNYIND